MHRTTALLVLSLLLGACDGPTAPITELPRELTVAEQELIAESNAFAFDLLREVDAQSDSANVFLSPLSASMALGMALNGAAGETFDSMRAVLGFDGLGQEAINASYRDLLELLRGLDPQVELGVANSVWARQGVPFETAFFTTVGDYFDAEARELDFGDPAARDQINDWVAQATGGRIEQIVDEIRGEDILFLINAVHFYGEWTHQFEKDRTRRAAFQVDSTTAVQVDMMSGTLPAGMASMEDVIIGELPYGGEAFAMVVAVPTGDLDLDELVQRLDATTWAEWMDALHYSDEVPVDLPRFEIRHDALLNGPLVALGMGPAFDPARSDFSRLTPHPDAHISRVKQKTFLKVDEEGTEAAAATSVAITVTSAPQGIRADRPFLLAIRERLSGTILFLGAIRDPR